MQSPLNSIHYHVCVSSIAGHLFDVTLTITKPDRNGQVLTLPAWIPGSYMIRDFAKHIVSMHAKDETGQELSLQKLDKQSWKVQPTSAKITIY